MSFKSFPPVAAVPFARFALPGGLPVRCAVFAVAISASATLADYEAPLPAYSPGTYYDGINTASVSTLKTQLRDRLDNGDVTLGYSAFADGNRDYIDRDPANPNNIILIYDRASLPARSGNSAVNTEHQWVDSRLPGAANGDYFNLRPSRNSINSDRSNLNFTSTRTATGAAGRVNVGGVTYWYAGDADRGDTARAMFYMATRWMNSGLTLVNGNPMTSGVNQMGDLQSLLKNHYVDGVDNYERRRSQNVFDMQKNRNPFVDHPEYVWAVFGGGNNNSRLAVSTPDADGGSALTVDLGRVMRGGTLGTGTATLTKTGASPTTLDITTSGNAVTAQAGAGQTIDYGNVTRNLTVGLAGGVTSSAGLKTGTVTIDNTDLTTGGAGLGSADGNDVITVSASVLDKRVVTPSVTSVNFGTLIRGGSASSAFTLTTTGDDNSATRVNVAGNSAVSGGIGITGLTTLFDAASDTGQRTIGGTFNTVGNVSGTAALAVTTAENGGAGLSGEGSYANIAVGYSAVVLAPSMASFAGGVDTNAIAIDLGAFDLGSTSTVTLSDLIYNRVAAAGFTAGLDLDVITPQGDDAIGLAGLFKNLAAGDAADLTATLDRTVAGDFSTTFLLGLSDQDLAGASAAGSNLLTLTLSATVVPEPAFLGLISLGGVALLRRRRA